jgi:hypothetical protein
MRWADMADEAEELPSDCAYRLPTPKLCEYTVRWLQSGVRSSGREKRLIGYAAQRIGEAKRPGPPADVSHDVPSGLSGGSSGSGGSLLDLVQILEQKNLPSAKRLLIEKRVEELRKEAAETNETESQLLSSSRIEVNLSLSYTNDIVKATSIVAACQC